MELFETVKEIIRKQPIGYQPIFISYPSWEEPGPICSTQEEADRWLSRQMMADRRKDCWGYVIQVTLEQLQAA